MWRAISGVFSTTTSNNSVAPRRRQSVESSGAALSRALPALDQQLDLSEVFSRIYIAGLPYRGPTSRGSHRNNVDELVNFLSARYGKRQFCVWNLAPSASGGKDDGGSYAEVQEKLRGQVLHFAPMLESATGSSSGGDDGLPQIGEIFRFIYSLQFWLDLNPQHVAVVHDTSGKQRAPFFVACYLAWAHQAIFHDGVEAITRVMEMRRHFVTDDERTMAALQHEDPQHFRSSWWRTLLHFDQLCGRLDRPVPARRLHVSSMLIYMSGPVRHLPASSLSVEVFRNHESVWASEGFAGTYPDDFKYDEGCLKVKIEQILQGDIVIHVYCELTAAQSRLLQQNHSSRGIEGMGPDASGTGQRKLLLRYAFHSNVLPADVIQVPLSHVDIFAPLLVLEQPKHIDEMESGSDVTSSVQSMSIFWMQLVLALPSDEKNSRISETSTSSTTSLSLTPIQQKGTDGERMANEREFINYVDWLNLRGRAASLAGLYHFSLAHSVFSSPNEITILVREFDLPREHFAYAALQVAERDLIRARLLLKSQFMRHLANPRDVPAPKLGNWRPLKSAHELDLEDSQVFLEGDLHGTPCEALIPVIATTVTSMLAGTPLQAPPGSTIKSSLHKQRGHHHDDSDHIRAHEDVSTFLREGLRAILGNSEDDDIANDDDNGNGNAPSSGERVLKSVDENADERTPITPNHTVAVSSPVPLMSLSAFAGDKTMSLASFTSGHEEGTTSEKKLPLSDSATNDDISSQQEKSAPLSTSKSTLSSSISYNSGIMPAPFSAHKASSSFVTEDIGPSAAGLLGLSSRKRDVGAPTSNTFTSPSLITGLGENWQPLLEKIHNSPSPPLFLAALQLAAAVQTAEQRTLAEVRDTRVALSPPISSSTSKRLVLSPGGADDGPHQIGTEHLDSSYSSDPESQAILQRAALNSLSKFRQSVRHMDPFVVRQLLTALQQLNESSAEDSRRQSQQSMLPTASQLGPSISVSALPGMIGLSPATTTATDTISVSATSSKAGFLSSRRGSTTLVSDGRRTPVESHRSSAPSSRRSSLITSTTLNAFLSSGSSDNVHHAAGISITAENHGDLSAARARSLANPSSSQTLPSSAASAVASAQHSATRASSGGSWLLSSVEHAANMVVGGIASLVPLQGADSKFDDDDDDDDSDDREPSAEFDGENNAAYNQQSDEEDRLQQRRAKAVQSLAGILLVDPSLAQLFDLLSSSSFAPPSSSTSSKVERNITEAQAKVILQNAAYAAASSAGGLSSQNIVNAESFGSNASIRENTEITGKKEFVGSTLGASNENVSTTSNISMGRFVSEKANDEYLTTHNKLRSDNMSTTKSTNLTSTTTSISTSSTVAPAQRGDLKSSIESNGSAIVASSSDEVITFANQPTNQKSVNNQILSNDTQMLSSSSTSLALPGPAVPASTAQESTGKASTAQISTAPAPAAPDPAAPAPAAPAPPAPAPPAPGPVLPTPPVVATADSALDVSRFKTMLKMGVPQGAVRAKMTAEGIPADVIERTLQSGGRSEPSSESSSALPEKEKQLTQVKSSDAPVLPLSSAPLAPQEAVSAAAAEKAEHQRIRIEKLRREQVEEAAEASKPLQDTALYGRFFKMLKVGTPLDQVRHSIVSAGFDVSLLDLDPTKPHPKPPTVLKEDATYAKYFKMLKFGLPRETVGHKITGDGLDDIVLELDADSPLPPSLSASSLIQKSHQQAAEAEAALRNQSRILARRRKRLHWEQLPGERALRGDTIWASAGSSQGSDGFGDLGDDLIDDEEEFLRLFTAEAVTAAASKEKKSEATTASSGKAGQPIVLLDSKRARGVGIALAKLRIPYESIRTCLVQLTVVVPGSSKELNLEALQVLEECLPTQEEVQTVKSYRGDKSKLGEAEKFFSVVGDVPKAKARASALAFQAQFGSRTSEVENRVNALAEACKAVKASKRLRKVLEAVLKLGNKLNAEETGSKSGAKVSAFTLNSLLKLSQTKAFDGKVSVLNYLAQILARKEPDSLLIGSELLPLVSPAARYDIHGLREDVASLRKDLGNIERLVREQARSSSTASSSSIAGQMSPVATTTCESSHSSAATVGEADSSSTGAEALTSFVARAQAAISALGNRTETSAAAFSDLVAFFGEDENMAVETFFSTLSAFLRALDRSKDENAEQEARAVREARRATAMAAATASQPSTSTVTAVAPPLPPPPQTPLSSSTSEIASEQKGPRSIFDTPPPSASAAVLTPTTIRGALFGTGDVDESAVASRSKLEALFQAKSNFITRTGGLPTTSATTRPVVNNTKVPTSVIPPPVPVESQTNSSEVSTSEEAEPMSALMLAIKNRKKRID